MPDPDARDLRDAIREDTSRGRRPIDMEARRLWERRQAQILEFYELRDREGILRAIGEYGIQPGSPEYEKIAQLVRELIP